MPFGAETDRGSIADLVQQKSGVVIETHKRTDPLVNRELGLIFGTFDLITIHKTQYAQITD